jgi:hypothetical protein
MPPKKYRVSPLSFVLMTQNEINPTEINPPERSPKRDKKR